MLPRIFFLVIGALFIIQSASAHQIDTTAATVAKRFFYFTPGYAFQQGRDEGMSPLTYNGSLFNGLIGLEKTKGRQFNQLSVSAAFGRMRPPRQPESRRSVALALRLQFDYCHERFLRSWYGRHLKLFAGATWNNMLNVLWHQSYLNNSLNYAFSSSIGPSATLRYNLAVRGKSFSLQAQLQLPLLAFNLRPAYASSIPEGFIAQERSNVRAFFDSGRLQTLNSFFRLRNNLSVRYQLANENEVFLSYGWDYFETAHRHRVQMAVHQILLGWRYRF